MLKSDALRHGLIAGALTVSALAYASGEPLTLAEAQRRAVERSLQLPAQDSAISAAQEMAVAAGQLPDPTLKLGIDNVPVNGPDPFSLTADSMTMRRIGLMQEFTRGAKRQHRAERFEREAERARAAKMASAAAIQRDTALAWLDRYFAEAMAAVLREQIAESRLEIEAAEGAYRAGRGTQADVFAARLARGELEDRLSAARRRIRTAITALARWIGDAGDAPLGGKPALDVMRLNREGLEADLAHHPELAVFAKQAEIAVAEAKVAQADKQADWSVEVAYAQRGPAFSNMVSIGVSVPLQWNARNRQDREVAAKLALAQQARAEREEMLRAHTGEVKAQIEEWDDARERLARYQRELVPIANERIAAALAAYRGAKAPLGDVLAARRGEIELRMQALQLEADAARLWARLNFLFPDQAALRPAGEAQ